MEVPVNRHILNSKYRKSLKVLMTKPVQHELQTTPTTTKTLYFDSEDKYIKKILVNHGWKVSANEEICQLKWVYNFKHNTFSQLSKNVRINHFPNSHVLTTKLGLCKTLGGQRGVIIGNHGLSHLEFYPLSEENDSFVKDFRRTAVLNLLKKMMIAVEIKDQEAFSRIYQKSQLLMKRKVEINWVKELQVLYSNEDVFEQDGNVNEHFFVNKKIFQGLLWYFSLMFTLDCQAGQNNFNQQQMNLLVEYSKLDPPYTSLQDHFEGDRNLARRPTQNALVLFFRLYQQARTQIIWFRTDGLRNIWVVKANDSSRGRNIVLVSSLQELKTLNSGTKLIQKYIEDTWIYRPTSEEQIKQYPFLSKLSEKKFDIRLWVLVRSFAPLEVFIYHEGYLRISKGDYQLRDIESNQTHLTNFTVNWKQDPLKAESSYVLLSQFLQYLHHEEIKDKHEMMKQINAVVLHTLQSVDCSVSNSDQRCFQFYGFDILLDSKLKPWILEANMSPACKERGRLVQELERMGSGLLSLVGLIAHSPYQSGWIPLTNTSRKITLQKQHSRSQGTNTLRKLRPQLTNLRCQQQCLNQSQTTSILPMISNGTSCHFKAQPINPIVDGMGLMVTGVGMGVKVLKRCDRFSSYLGAVRIIQRCYNKMMKERNIRQKDIIKPPNQVRSLTFLRLLECLIVISKKGKVKPFKRLKRLLKKKSLINYYSIK